MRGYCHRRAYKGWLKIAGLGLSLSKLNDLPIDDKLGLFHSILIKLKFSKIHYTGQTFNMASTVNPSLVSESKFI